MELDTKEVQKSQKISMKRTQIAEYIIDETIIKVGSEYIWLWVAIEPKDKEILEITVSKERNICLLLQNDFFQIL